LPAYVTRFVDRHGKERLRFRRKGYPARYFTAPLGTSAFRAEYDRFNSPEAAARAIEDNHAARTIPGSIGDLLRRYLAVPERLGPSEVTRTKVRRILERFADGREARLVRDVRFEHIDAIISKTRVKREGVDGRKVGGIEAARKLRKELVRLFDFAESIDMIAKSPMKHVRKIKVAANERSTGYHTWTEEELAQYRDRWPLGTKQRLAMELLLWTDQRKVDAIHLGPQHVKNGRFVIRQSKTGKILRLLIAPQLAAAINAMPKSHALCFILTEWGKPFSVAGFGNWFRDQCDAADLPHCTAHGLRKSTMRRMAELQMPNKTMKSVSGHSKDEEVSRYTEAANQERLADSALTRLAKWEVKAVKRCGASPMSNLAQKVRRDNGLND
jgi:integrase